jgi:hypothetical protein
VLYHVRVQVYEGILMGRQRLLEVGARGVPLQEWYLRMDDTWKHCMVT